jgi:hypothetical protein
MVDHVAHHPLPEYILARHVQLRHCCSKVLVVRGPQHLAAGCYVLVERFQQGTAFDAASCDLLAIPLTTAAAKIGIAAKWLASLPRVDDLSYGLHSNFSSGTHSRIVRVFAISRSNSETNFAPIVIWPILEF